MTIELSESRLNNVDPIILLHGWGMNASVFQPVEKILSVCRQTICVDLPGYGGNPWQAGLSFGDQAASIAASLPGGILIGWSMGGLYATEIARQNPKRFTQLILVCSNPCFVHRADWRCAVRESVFDTFANDLARGWSATIRRFLSLQMLGDKNARPLIRDLVTNIQSAGEPGAEVLRFGLDLLKTCDSRSVLADIEIPVKMILGERDQMVPAGLAKEILKINPKIEVELIASAAHAPFLSHPDHFISLI
jgi:pimeloyl-[acyl-carrier protein] methyl ester esterase